MLFIKAFTSYFHIYRPSPPSAVASPHRPPSSPIGLPHRGETAEERFNMLARGWLAYPVTPTHHPSTAEERLYKRHPIGLPRPVTPCAIRRERSLRFPEAPLFALINYCFLTA